MNKQKRVIAFSLIAGAIPSFFIGANYSNEPAITSKTIVGLERFVYLPSEVTVKVEPLKDDKKKKPKTDKQKPPKADEVEPPKPSPMNPRPLPTVTP